MAEAASDAHEKLQTHFSMNTEASREASGGDLPSLAKNRDFVDYQVSETLSTHTSLPSHVDDQPLHILIVEHNPVNQKLLKMGLTRHGYIVSVVNNGIEALDFIQDSEYWVGVTNGKRLSVVLMEVAMPIMDGVTCVRKIREAESRDEIRGQLPVIAVTANAGTFQEMLDAGMDDVVTTPWRISDIVGHVEKLLARLKDSSKSG